MNRRAVITVIVSIILGLLSVWAGLVALSFGVGQSAYKSGDYARAATSYSVAARVLPGQFGGWKAHFNQGSAELKLGALDSGIPELRRALIDVPKSDPEQIVATENPEEFTQECVVRYNLAVGLEMEGDRYMAAENPQEAELSYREASAVVEYCVPQSPQHEEQKQSTDSKADQAEQDRQSEGQQDQQNDGNPNQGGNQNQDSDPSAGNDPSAGTDPSGGASESPQDNSGQQTDPWEGHNGSGKEQELRERGKEAEERAREEQSRQGGYSDWDGQNW